MKKFLLFIFTITVTFSAFSQEDIKFSLDTISTTNITTKPRSYPFIALKTSHGTVFQSNKFVSGENRIPYYSSFSLKFGFSTNGTYWQDCAFGMPYMGIGIYGAHFYKRTNLGAPISIFFFQGGHLTDYTKPVSLNYEWNVGASFRWNKYDPFDNPDNVAIGSTVNIHFGANLYMKWRMSKRWDLDAGIEFNHFSNGASLFPNYGMNLASGFVQLNYYFNREDKGLGLDGCPLPPLFEKKKDHDIMILITSRNAELDTLGTGLPSKYTEQTFKVLGLSYAYMINNHYRYKWGPSIEISYDESAGVRMWREVNPRDGGLYERVKLGDFWGRFSVGLSMKGEIKMPGYSAFFNLGYDIIHAKESDGRFYQIFGVKVYLKDNFFGTFGIRATDFGKSQYIFLNFGYTIHQPLKKDKFTEIKVRR